MCESTSKFGKFIKSLNNNKQVKKLLSLGILLTFSVFIIFMIFQLILPVLLTPNNYGFQDQVTSPSDRLLLVNQTFTKLDMVYSDFLWSPPDMVLVLILDSRKYGHHQIYLYNEMSIDLFLNHATFSKTACSFSVSYHHNYPLLILCLIICCCIYIQKLLLSVSLFLSHLLLVLLLLLFCWRPYCF